MKIKRYINIKNKDDDKEELIERKALLTFYDKISVHSDLVNVFKINFFKIMIRSRNKKKFKKALNTSVLSRFVFVNVFSLKFISDIAEKIIISSTLFAADIKEKAFKTANEIDAITKIIKNSAVKTKKA